MNSKIIFKIIFEFILEKGNFLQHSVQLKRLKSVKMEIHW